MKLTDEQFQRMLKRVESRNRGWIRAEHNLGPVRVLLDGKEINVVIAVNRRKGKAVVSYQPLRICKHRKKVMGYMVYGEITLERINEIN